MEISTIDRQTLEAKFNDEPPGNDSQSDGWALVNVLDEEAFEQGRIPGSINIPLDQLERFDERFSRDKEIVVYCASTDCEASPKAARALTARGFENVEDYEGGLADWREAGRPITTGGAEA